MYRIPPGQPIEVVDFEDGVARSIGYAWVCSPALPFPQWWLLYKRLAGGVDANIDGVWHKVYPSKLAAVSELFKAVDSLRSRS